MKVLSLHIVGVTDEEEGSYLQYSYVCTISACAQENMDEPWLFVFSVEWQIGPLPPRSHLAEKLMLIMHFFLFLDFCHSKNIFRTLDSE